MSQSANVVYQEKSQDVVSRITYFAVDKVVYDGKTRRSFEKIKSEKEQRSTVIDSIHKARKFGDKKTAPLSLKLSHNVEAEMLHGFPATKIKNKKGSGSKLIVYLHGGAFVMGPMAVQWRLTSYLLKRLPNFDAVFMDYPKAPEHNASKTLEVMVASYKTFLEDYKAEDIVIVGDSAGATIALSLLLELRKADLAQPSKVFVLSPCVDLNYNNSAMAPLRASDRMLYQPVIQHMLKIYADDLSLDDSLVSPLFGDFNDTAPIYMFVGTDELNYPDCMLFHKNVSASNTKIQTFVGKDMQHDWLLFPTKDADIAKRKIVEIISYS